MERKVRKLRHSKEKKHFEMLNLCFNPWGSEEHWRRLYGEPGFDVTENVLVVEENGEWIGGVTGWFREALLKNGKKVEVYMAGDGYSVPNYRGRGVYSTFMKSMNSIAQEKGAALGLGFINVYAVPFVALPKYGFADVFYPQTRILVLNPENFFRYMIKRVQGISFPANFEGTTLRLIVTIDSLDRKTTMSKEFQVVKGEVRELTQKAKKESMDLTVKTDIDTLLNLSFHLARYLYAKNKTIFRFLIVALLRRRLRLRFSPRFLRTFLRML